MKRLAKDTVIYGLSSILGKFLNWCLVPLYTYKLHSTGDYGVVNYLYGWTAFLQIVLTYGMETGFFRYANKSDLDEKRVYSTTLSSVGTTTVIFIVLGLLFAPQLGDMTSGYGVRTEYISMLVLTVAMDAFSAIPFAYLRYKNRPIRFASLKMLFIFLNIVTNLFFLIICPLIQKSHPEWISWFYNPDYGVGYVFVSNLISTFIQTLFLMPQVFGFKYNFDWNLLKQMLKYSFPLLILGIAGILSQTIDKMMFPSLFPDKETAMDQLGIYGANTRIAVVMMMFTQAFRFAYEPLVFAKSKGEDNKAMYANAMKFFIIFTLLIFLGIMFYIDLLKYIIKPTYFSGLPVVPLVMLGQLFFGIYFNLSIWYKLTDKTKWGAYFSVIVCVLTIVLNITLVPHFGYMGCAWATLVSNLIVMVLSYFMGQKEFPITYDMKSIGLYTALSVGLYIIYLLVDLGSVPLNLAFRTVLMAVFIAYMVKKDMPLNQLPLINKLVKR
jgi:Membrane protein involved in the export of O-antigen and teichoic acid